MTTLYLDLETYSEERIQHGTHRYAERAEILLLAYAIDDGHVQVWDVTAGGPMPRLLGAALTDPDVLVCAHNSHFDRTVLRHVMPDLCPPVERWRDTMVKALAHGLPGKLDTLCEVLGLPQDQRKLKVGGQLINRFCKPQPAARTLRRATRGTHPEEWALFVEYAGADIVAMREIDKRLPTWNYKGEELDLWHLDQRINDRGVAVDLELAQAAIDASERTKAELAARTADLTGGEVQATTQRDALLAHLLEQYGVNLPDLRASTLERRIDDPDLPAVVRELLGNRLAASTTSVSKYKTLVNATSSDGRLRGTLQFCGAARTGRWAGRLFQPQNLPRPTMKQAAIDAGIDALKAGVADLLGYDVMQLCSSAVRSALVAPQGRKLVVADLSNIEGRMVAWLAGESWKLRAFRDFDAGAGPDLYVAAYSKSFNVSTDTVLENKKSGDGMMRQIGKVQELALAYQGAVGAFSSMAAIYGVNLPEDQVLKIVQAWRAAHPEIVGFWYEIEGEVIRAINTPGVTMTCRRLKLRRDGTWLRIGLPSGRCLCYPGVALNEDGRITYMGMNQYTRKWERLQTYGGKLVENVTQAAARDVMANGMRLAEAGEYRVLLTVHDELITEADDEACFSADELGSLLATVPAWAPGLPLAAAGFETYRYKKD